MDEENTSLSELSSSILSSVKKFIGISDDDVSFDLDIMMSINGASSILYQLGVIQKPFTITSKDDTYEDLVPGGSEDIINMIKMYFVYKTRLSFDSSTLGSSVIAVIQEEIKELEWRMMITFNPDDTFE